MLLRFLQLYFYKHCWTPKRILSVTVKPSAEFFVLPLFSAAMFSAFGAGIQRRSCLFAAFRQSARFGDGGLRRLSGRDGRLQIQMRKTGWHHLTGFQPDEMWIKEHTSSIHSRLMNTIYLPLSANSLTLSSCLGNFCERYVSCNRSWCRKSQSAGGSSGGGQWN